MSRESSGFRSAFGGTFGVVTALLVVLVGLPLVVMMLFCGGCALLVPAVDQAREAARRAEEKQLAEQAEREQPEISPPAVTVIPETPPTATDVPEPPAQQPASPPADSPPTTATPEIQTEPKPEPPDERRAASTLRLAKTFIDRRDEEKAREWLQKVVDEFPGTDAAEEAAKLLQGL